MIKVDIAMTAVIRPKIFNETLATIVDKVVDIPERFRLVLNIDPVGEKVNPEQMYRVAKKHFSTVIYNIPKVPSFPKAVKWIWSRTSAPFVLHWEDDVNILRKIDIDHMIRILKKYDDLSSLRLFSKRAGGKSMRVFQARWVYNKDGFYLANDWRSQFGLNPILIKQEFVSEAVTRMVDYANPEKQFRVSQEYMRPLIRKWKYGIYARPGEKRLIDGRKGQRWKDKMGLDKPGGGNIFLKWVKK
jgi:hypothetical protein